MGRLIDGDKLRKQMSEDYAQSVSKISNPTVKAIVEKAVETFDGYVMSAEAVEAIPVPWIRKYMKEVCLTDVKYMLETWEKEQIYGKTD